MLAPAPHNYGKPGLSTSENSNFPKKGKEFQEIKGSKD